MLWSKKQRGEREVTRAIHQLFWQANFVKKPQVLATYAMRIPAFAIFNILIPLIIAFGIQSIIQKQFETVATYIFYILGLAVIYAILWGFSGFIISKAGSFSTAYIQRKVFQNYLNKDYDFYTTTFFGSLGAQAIRLRDAFIEYNMIVMVSLPKQIVIVVAGIGVIAYHSLLLSIVTLIAMGAVLSFTILSSSWRLKYRRRVSELGSEVAGVVGDSLTQSHAVKSFAAEIIEQRRLDKSLEPWRIAQYKSWLLSVPSDLGRALLAFIATAVLLVVTAKLYQGGEISIAIVALVQLYVIRLIASTLEIAEMIKSYEHVMGGAYQPVKTMFVRPTIVDAPDAKQLQKNKKPAVVFDQVSFRYADSAEGSNAVTNFSLAVRPGQKIGLVGYSGSGKTTLTKLLLRFMDVTGGSIKVAGVDVRNLKQKSLRQQIAYVPQEPLLFHRSISENIAYGHPGATEAEVRRAAKMAYIDEFIQELPMGYETMVGERGIKLSGGQRQRIAIARAILKDAPILVLDEATSALDSRSERYIQEALQNLLKNRTALVIAHRLSTIQRLDKIIVMDKGQIVQQGTHQKLLNDTHGTYAELWAHQSGGYINGRPKPTENADEQGNIMYTKTHQEGKQ